MSKPAVSLDDVNFVIKDNGGDGSKDAIEEDEYDKFDDDCPVGKEQPLTDFNKVTKISGQLYDGVFEIDDEEEEDSDAFIENQVAQIANGLKTHAES